MDTAKCFAVKVPSAAGKHTTVNPKFDILQQGYDPVNKVSHVQTMEPLLLSSWAHNYAMPPGSYRLDMSIDGNYLRNLISDVSGQYGCASTSGAMVPFGASPPAASAAKARHVYCRVKDIALHVRTLWPLPQCRIYAQGGAEVSDAGSSPRCVARCLSAPPSALLSASLACDSTGTHVRVCARARACGFVFVCAHPRARVCLSTLQY